MTECGICKQNIPECLFQQHLIECHNLLFVQYIGLIGSKVDITKYKYKKEEKKKLKKKT